MLGQFKTAAKGNEITAIPELIDALQVQGATLSIDAAGCQHAVVGAIVAKQADCIISVKNNQPTLAQAIEKLFDANDRGELEAPLAQVVVVDKGHGRVETRQCVLALDLIALGKVTQGRKTGIPRWNRSTATDDLPLPASRTTRCRSCGC